MTYYTLLVRDNPTSKWQIAFGDYDREVVDQEYADSYSEVKRGNRKILKTASAHQHVISAAIDALNGEVIHR